MKLHSPFLISARLLPAIVIGQGAEAITVSADKACWWLDGPFGEHKVTDYRPSPGSSLVASFEGLLAFMSAAGDSFSYAERRGLAEFELSEAIHAGTQLIEAQP